MAEITINQAILSYLDSVALSRSEHTARTYHNALKRFLLTLDNHDVSPEKAPIAELTEDAVAWFAAELKGYAPASESLYLTVLAGFYEYLAAERLADPNLPRVRLLIRQRARKPGVRLPQFPKSQIAEIIEYAINLASRATEDEPARLRNLRDRCFPAHPGGHRAARP